MRTLSILAVGLAMAAPALAGTCPTAQEMGIRPAIEVQTAVPSAQYRNDVGRAKLTEMMRGPGSNAGAHGTVLGLTYGTYEARWSIEAIPVPRGNVYCHYLKTADLRLTIPSLTVYVASEYRQGSCQFTVIANHENEHVRVNQYVLRKYAPVIKAALNRQAQQLLPIVSANPDAAREIQAAFSPTINTLLRDMYGERDRGNAGIDTDYQYQRTSQQCARW